VSSETINVLKDLIDAPSPSGFEQPAQEVFRAAIAPYADDVQTDLLGNVYGIVNPGGSPKIMLAGHCDEIGFIVNYISSEGFIYFGPIGGHDPNIVVGQRVYVHTHGGPLLGVVGRKPVHLMEEEERGRKINLHDLFIDIGAKGKTAVADRVAIGDPITFASGFATLREDLAVSHAFDNKIGAYIVSEVIRLLKGKTISAAVYGVSTVQEEVGLRGARTSAYWTGATVGIAIDVGHTSDYPSVSKTRVGDLELGKGPILTRGSNTNPEAFKILREVGDAHGIPYQLKADGRPTGTDANAMQVNQAGMATANVAIPLRYMHTPCEVISLTDADNTALLIALFIEAITPDTDFTPRLSNLHSLSRGSAATPAAGSEKAEH